MKNIKSLILILILFTTISVSYSQRNINISNINKPNYVISDSLKIGSNMYCDKTIGIRQFPDFLLNSIYIRTASEDKYAQTDDFLYFEVNKEITLFIAHSSNIKNTPLWLKVGFEKTPFFVDIDGDKHFLYKKNFKPG